MEEVIEIDGVRYTQAELDRMKVIYATAGSIKGISGQTAVIKGQIIDKCFKDDKKPGEGWWGK